MSTTEYRSEQDRRGQGGSSDTTHVKVGAVAIHSEAAVFGPHLSTKDVCI
jgi:hypothetical protein